MAVIMRKALGERLLLDVPASSRFGAGRLYITDQAVAYEVDGMGLYLNFVPRGIIRSIRPVGGPLLGARRFVMEWTEGGARHAFEFRTREHRRLEEATRGMS